MYQSILRTCIVMVVVAASVLTATRDAAASWPLWPGCCGVPSVGWTGYNYSYHAGWAGWDGLCYEPAVAPYWYGVPRIAPVRNLLSRLAYRWRTHYHQYLTPIYDPYCCVPGCYVMPAWCSVCGCAISDCGCGAHDAGVIYDQPTEVPEHAPTPATPPAAPQQDLPDPDQQSARTRDSAFLSVRVPGSAQVYVNGIATRSVGQLRQYVSRDMLPGFQYTYEVRAEAVVNGSPVTRTKTVHLRAGDQVELAFDFAAQEPLETSLTLHVPRDAQVFLAGRATRGNGAVRIFRTTQLKQGEAWSQYVVRVVLDRDGRQLDRDATITLRAGERKELTFDFDLDKVAAIR